jgi:hypothetical protein
LIHTTVQQSVRFNSFHPFRRREGMTGRSPLGFSASFRISAKVLFPLGIASRQGTSTFSVNEHQPESLRSTAITRCQHYYALIRLPMQPRRSYAFPRKVGRDRLIGINMPPICPPHGSSQVSDLTFDARCSQPPRIARQLHLPVASLSMIDCAISGRLVTIKLRNEAESDSQMLRLASLSERIPPPPITQRKRRRTTCQTGNLHDNLLTGYKLKQTYLAIPEVAERGLFY